MKQIRNRWMRRILPALFALLLVLQPVGAFASERTISDTLNRWTFLSDTGACIEFKSNTSSRDIRMMEGDYVIVSPFHRVNTNYLSYSLQDVACSDPSVVSVSYKKESGGELGLKLHALLEGTADVTATFRTYKTRAGNRYVDKRSTDTFTQKIHVTVDSSGSVDMKLNISGGKYSSVKGVTLSMVKMMDTLSERQLMQIQDYITGTMQEYVWGGTEVVGDTYGTWIVDGLVDNINSAVAKGVVNAGRAVTDLFSNIFKFFDTALLEAQRINHAYVYAKYASMRVPVFAPQHLTLTVTVTNNTKHVIKDISVLLNAEDHLSFTSITGPFGEEKNLIDGFSLDAGETRKFTAQIYPRFVYGTLSPDGGKVKAYESNITAKLSYTDSRNGKSGSLRRKAALDAYTTITEEKLQAYKNTLVQEYRAENVDAFTSSLLGGAFNGYKRWYGYSCFSQVFVFACPVEAVIANQAGEELAVLAEAGDTYSGDGITGFVADEAKYVIVQPDMLEKYQIRARATDDGSMDAMTYEYDRETGLCVKTYDDVQLTKGNEFELQTHPEMAADLGTVDASGAVSLLEATDVLDQEMLIAGLMEDGLTEEEADVYAYLLIRGVMPEDFPVDGTGTVTAEAFCSLLLNVAEEYFGIALDDTEEEDASAVQRAQNIGLLTKEEAEQIEEGTVTVDIAAAMSDHLLRKMGFVDNEIVVWDWLNADEEDGNVAEDGTGTADEVDVAEGAADAVNEADVAAEADTGEADAADADTANIGEADAADANTADTATEDTATAETAGGGTDQNGEAGFSGRLGLLHGVSEEGDLTAGEAAQLASGILDYAEMASERDSLIGRMGEAYKNSMRWSDEYSFVGLYANEPDRSDDLLLGNYAFWFPATDPDYAFCGSMSGYLIPECVANYAYITQIEERIESLEAQGYERCCCPELSGTCVDADGNVYRWMPFCYINQEKQIYQDAVYLMIAKVSEGSAIEYMESHGVEVNLDDFGALLTTYLIADQDVVASVLNLSPTGKVDAVTDEEYEELQEGSSGDAVAALQRSLILDGYLTGTADGAYGAGTAAAVRAYQEAKGLEVSGIADSQTQAQMYLDSASVFLTWAKSHSSEEIWLSAMEELSKREEATQYHLPENDLELQWTGND